MNLPPRDEKMTKWTCKRSTEEILQQTGTHSGLCRGLAVYTTALAKSFNRLKLVYSWSFNWIAQYRDVFAWVQQAKRFVNDSTVWVHSYLATSCARRRLFWNWIWLKTKCLCQWHDTYLQTFDEKLRFVAVFQMFSIKSKTTTRARTTGGFRFRSPFISLTLF